jgi:hypothetical protein
MMDLLVKDPERLQGNLKFGRIEIKRSKCKVIGGDPAKRTESLPGKLPARSSRL